MPPKHRIFPGMKQSQKATEQALVQQIRRTKNLVKKLQDRLVVKQEELRQLRGDNVWIAERAYDCGCPDR